MLGAKVAMALLANMLKNLTMRLGLNLLIHGKPLPMKTLPPKNLGSVKLISPAKNAMISIMMSPGRTRALNENGLKLHTLLQHLSNHLSLYF